MESQFEKVDKQRKTTEKESTSDDESTVTLHTILDVSKHVRSDLRKWVKRQEKSYLQEVQEGELYSLHIVPKGCPGDFGASIRCLNCGNTILLQKKASRFLTPIGIGI